MGNLKPEQIKKITIGGNTTMGHLLMGFSCKNLGVYPFIPVNISTITGSFEEILGKMEGAPACPVILLPGISTYVGGDILSGLLSCGFDEKEPTALLVDLGTNGEMAVGNQNRILVTSTAAGPAFEGGNIPVEWAVWPELSAMWISLTAPQRYRPLETSRQKAYAEPV